MDVAEVEIRRAALARELGSVAGGASLCTVSASGGPVDGVKYLEGRVAALTEVRRGLRAGSQAGELLDALAQRWGAELHRAQGESLGRGWVAYRAGGVDELAALRELVRAATGRT